MCVCGGAGTERERDTRPLDSSRAQIFSFSVLKNYPQSLLVAFQVPWVLLSVLSPYVAPALSPVKISLPPPRKASPGSISSPGRPVRWGCSEGKEEPQCFLLGGGGG